MTRITRVGFSTGAAFALAVSAEARTSFRTVMLTNTDQVPGAATGSRFTQTVGSSTIVNNAGLVAFSSAFNPPGAQLSTGIWSEAIQGSEGTLGAVVLQGAPAPDAFSVPIPGATFGAFGQTLVNLTDAGQATFLTQLEAPNSSWGVWSKTGPNMIGVAVAGQPTMPAFAGGIWRVDDSSRVSLANSGRVVFKSLIESGVTYTAVVSGEPTSPTVCSQSTTSSSDPGFTTFTDSTINESGTIALLASYRVEPGGQSRPGVFRGACGAPVPIAVAGDFTPVSLGFPISTKYSVFGPPRINSSGDMVFATLISGPGIASNTGGVIVRVSAANGFTLIARQGDQIPGQPAGCLFGDFFAGNLVGPIISSSGAIAFETNISGPSGRAIIYRTPAGAFGAIARSGDPMPGYPAGANYQTLGGIALNTYGELLYGAATLTPPAGRGSEAIYLVRPGRSPSILVESNTPYVLRPGVTAKLSSITQPLTSGGNDSVRRNFNDAAQYGFRATFADVNTPANQGVSVLVATPPPCPADLNHDYTVNTADLTILLLHFGQSVPSGSQGDLNHDATISTADLTLLLVAFGQTCP